MFDLLVIGAGPGGYTAAIRAAQLGMKVACVEKEARLGGTCLRVGCIPSKALLESSERYVEARDRLAEHGVRTSGVELDLAAMLRRKEGIVEDLTKGVAGLLRKNEIERIVGRARFLSPGRIAVGEGDEARELDARAVLIATGSRSAPLRGVELDGERIVTSTEALSFPEVPEHLVVIGAGYIGLELGSVWSRLGSRVTVVEALGGILPGMDAEIAEEARKVFERQGLTLKLSTRVAGATRSGEACTVEIEGEEGISCDRVLLSVGRVPNTEGLDLEAAGVEVDARGFVRTGENYATTASAVFAVGDVIGGAMLAHKAEEEGIACVEALATGAGHVRYDAIPAIVYTHPEIATVGRTEEQLKEAGVPYRKGIFPYLANGRARALGDVQGRVKILAHAETDLVLGVHVLGARAGDLIAEAVCAMEFGATSEDIARTCHAHPTLSEIVKEAALAVDGRAVHI